MKKNLKFLIGGLLIEDYNSVISNIKRFLDEFIIYNKIEYSIAGSCSIAIILNELVEQDLSVINNEEDKQKILSMYTKFKKPNDLDIHLYGSTFNGRGSNMRTKISGMKKKGNKSINNFSNEELEKMSEKEKYNLVFTGIEKNVINSTSNSGVILRDKYFSGIELIRNKRDKQYIIKINGINIICLNKLIKTYSMYNRPNKNILNNGTSKKDLLNELYEVIKKYETLKEKYIKNENSENNNE